MYELGKAVRRAFTQFFLSNRPIPVEEHFENADPVKPNSVAATRAVHSRTDEAIAKSTLEYATGELLDVTKRVVAKRDAMLKRVNGG